MKRAITLCLVCLMICAVACGVEPTPGALPDISPTPTVAPENAAQETNRPLAEASATAPPQASPTPPPSFVSYAPGIRVVRVGVLEDRENPQWAANAQQEINRLLEEEGAGVRLEIVQIGTELVNTVPTLRGGRLYIGDGRNGPPQGLFHASVLGEFPNRFDLFPALGFLQERGEWAEAGLVMDITDLLPDFPDLYAINQEQVWREESMDGRNYWLPLTAFPQGVNFTHEIQMDPAWLEELNAEPPQTVEELTELLRRASAKGLACKLSVSNDTPPYALHRTYDEWPFHVDYDSTLIYYPDGTTEPYIGSDIYRKDAALLQELDGMGLIQWCYNGNVPLIPKDLNIAMGLYGTYKRTAETFSASLEPDRPRTRTSPLLDGAMFVRAGYEHPEAALEMLQYLYCNEKIYMAFTHGVEGTDWKVEADGSFSQMNRIGVCEYVTHHTISQRYQTTEQLEGIESLLAQEYPFSGFVGWQTDDQGPRLPGLNWMVIPISYFIPKGEEMLTAKTAPPEYQALVQERQEEYRKFLR